MSPLDAQKKIDEIKSYAERQGRELTQSEWEKIRNISQFLSPNVLID